jgi:hypothetical protein
MYSLIVDSCFTKNEPARYILATSPAHIMTMKNITVGIKIKNIAASTINNISLSMMLSPAVIINTMAVTP